MLDRAKAFTNTVQSLGGALLSALEKKDVEELTLLRSTHEQNLLKMTKEIKKRQIEESIEQIKVLESNKKDVKIRMEYYSELIDKGLNIWESLQSTSIHYSTILQNTENLENLKVALIHLLPQVGAPTSMNFGGNQLGRSLNAFKNVFEVLGKIHSTISASAGIEATFQRREQEWKQQLKLAEQQLKAVEQQIIAANIRLAIAAKDLEIHEKQIEQAKELEDFYKSKFTNLKLYTFLAKTLNSLYRRAYNQALMLAKQAERSCQFETDQLSYFIEGDNWDAGHAGLLAGERLLQQLQAMEQAYIKNMPRREEITQSFSLLQIDPGQIINLRGKRRMCLQHTRNGFLICFIPVITGDGLELSA